MVDVNTLKGLKTQAGYWGDKILLGGSGFQQTAGPIQEFAVSGTQSTAWVSGTISGTFIVGVTSLSGLNVFTPGSLQVAGSTIVRSAYITNITGSPFGMGNVIQLTARTIITGGMWVSTSGNSLALAAGASTVYPLGVARATAGSNATVDVVTDGIVALVAEATIEGGAGVIMGAAGALNGVVGAGSPTALGVRGVAVNRAVSGGDIFIRLF